MENSLKFVELLYGSEYHGDIIFIDNFCSNAEKINNLVVQRVEQKLKEAEEQKLKEAEEQKLKEAEEQKLKEAEEQVCEKEITNEEGQKIVINECVNQ